MKKLLIGIGLGVLAAWLWQVVGPLRWLSPKPAAAQATDSAKVERRTINVTIEAVGEINPANLVTVKPEVPGPDTRRQD